MKGIYPREKVTRICSQCEAEFSVTLRWAKRKDRCDNCTAVTKAKRWRLRDLQRASVPAEVWPVERAASRLIVALGDVEHAAKEFQGLGASLPEALAALVRFINGPGYRAAASQFVRESARRTFTHGPGELRPGMKEA